jgi:predicted DNA binding CopG/RHH family protein
MSKLNREEREILEAFEKGQLKRSKKAAAEIKQKEGIPYQTLVSSVLHKYVDGQLVEKNG